MQSLGVVEEEIVARFVVELGRTGDKRVIDPSRTDGR